MESSSAVIVHTPTGAEQPSSTASTSAERMAERMPPSTPPHPPLVPVHNAVEQCAGALLTMIGVSFTVLGLHGMTVNGRVGRVSACTMSLRWYGYVCMWAFGQALQLLAVQFAEEPIVATSSNFAIVVNAVLAHSMLGEPIGLVDVLAIVAMAAGACLVVVFVPRSMDTLSLLQLDELFTGSPWALSGLAVTTCLPLVLAIPRLVLRAPHAPGSGGIAWGLLAGWSGATSMTAAKICMLLFDNYAWHVFALLWAWPVGLICFLGEVGMVAFVYQGMGQYEASVVVPTYYVSMTILASVQALCIFPTKGARLSTTSTVGFSLGVLVCLVAVGFMAGVRSRRRPSVRVNRTGLLDGIGAEENVHCSLPRPELRTADLARTADHLSHGAEGGGEASTVQHSDMQGDSHARSTIVRPQTESMGR